MTYLYREDGLRELDAFMRPNTLFAFDLDGTLAPIIADPALVSIPLETKDALIALNDLAPLAIVSGRARHDLLRALGFTPRYAVGNHGAEGLPGREKKEAAFHEICSGWARQLRPLLEEQAEQILFEDKGSSLSLHYRAAIDPEGVHALILAAFRDLVPQPKRVSGKFVENLVVHGAPNKGDAVLALMKDAQCSRALFVGDDTTDEDVFRMEDESIFGIRVGQNPASKARFFVTDPKEVQRLLLHLIQLHGRLAR